MTRVLMTADTIGGVWTYAVELARALAAHGVEVVIATMGAPVRPAQRQQAAGLRLCESRFKLEWMEDPWCDVEAAGEWLLELEGSIRPDIVHLNGYAHAALPWNAPVMVVAHSCVLSWWQAVKREAAPPAWRRYREAVAAGLRAAGMVVAPTRAMLAEVERLYGTPANARVIPNGRRASSAAAKEPMVLAAGRLWDEGKNLAALHAAAFGLPWPVYVAGETTPGMNGSVRALGHLDPGELARWMGRASIYALPALYEPFGLSVLEAALAGCALVLGGIPSLRENWQGAAEFVDPEDIAELHATLRRLMCDFEHRARLTAAAQRRARRFTPERMAAAYLDAYRGLAKTAGR